MTADDITSARLRELADAMHPSLFGQAWATLAAAALRGAADSLAAREALLRRAGEALSYARPLVEKWTTYQGDNAEFREQTLTPLDALAAEIAAALEETEQ